jgi:transcription antitermination factor NusG
METACVRGKPEQELEGRKMTHPWFALQVRARHEALVASHLSARGFELFLPLYLSSRKWSDRVKEVSLPLFPGYVFCRLDVNNRFPVLSAPGVNSIVGIGKIPIALDENEIAAIQAMVKSGLPSQPWPFLKVGQAVRIEHGPLCGMEGILMDFKGRHRLVLSVTLLQRSVAVEVENGWVKPLTEQSQSSNHSRRRPTLLPTTA